MEIAATTVTPVAHAQAIIIVIKVESFLGADTGDELFCDAVLALDGLIALGVTVFVSIVVEAFCDAVLGIALDGLIVLGVILSIVLGVTVFVPIVVGVLVTEPLGVRFVVAIDV